MKAIKTNLYKQLSVKSQTFNIVKVQQTGIFMLLNVALHKYTFSKHGLKNKGRY